MINLSPAVNCHNDNTISKHNLEEICERILEALRKISTIKLSKETIKNE